MQKKLERRKVGDSKGTPGPRGGDSVQNEAEKQRAVAEAEER
jgi:hypothetical protein